MTRQPKVSILTPAFRHADFIASTIQSVRAQSFEDWEMIVIDDGSDDGTADVAEAVKEDRVKVFREPHRGIERLDETYNKGLSEAQGPLIAILEGDDLWQPHKLETQVPDFADETVVLSAGRIEIDTGGKDARPIAPTTLPELQSRNNSPVGAAAIQMLRPWVLTFTWPLTVVMRREALERAGGFRKTPYLPLVDFPTFLHMARQGQWRVHDEVFGIWRRHNESVTKNRFSQILHGAYRLASEFAKEFGEEIGLTATDRKSLDLEWANMQTDRLMLLGRVLAADNRFTEAAKAFHKARSFVRGRNTRAMLLAAAVSSRTHITPEWAMKLGKRGDWRTDLAAFGVDAMVMPDESPNDFLRHSF